MTGAAGRGEGPYAALLGRAARGLRRAGASDHPTPAEEVAAAVVAAALDPAGPFRVPVGDDAHLLAAPARVDATDERVWQDELLGFLEIDWPRRTP